MLSPPIRHGNIGAVSDESRPMNGYADPSVDAWS